MTVKDILEKQKPLPRQTAVCQNNTVIYHQFTAYIDKKILAMQADGFRTDDVTGEIFIDTGKETPNENYIL